MRFLVDECLPKRLSAMLAGAGHDAAHVVDLGLAGAADADVLRAAATQRRVLVSVDTDFGFLLAKDHLAGPSVILLRGVSYLAEEQLQMILACASTASEDLELGCMAVVSGRGARIRRLPIG